MADAWEWLKFYAVPYLLDPNVNNMSLEAQGANVRLQAYAWNSKPRGHLTSNPAELAKISTLGREGWTRAGNQILEAWVTSDDGTTIYHPELVKQAEDIERRIALSSKGGKNKGGVQAPLESTSSPLEGYLNGASRGLEAGSKPTPTDWRSEIGDLRSETSKKKKKDRAAGATPLPFSVDQALGHLAAAGRFVQSRPSKGQAITVQKLIREFSDAATWLDVGAWLAAGGEAWKSSVDVRNIGDFPAWAAQAARWSADGRGPVAGKYAPVSTEAPSWRPESRKAIDIIREMYGDDRPQPPLFDAAAHKAKQEAQLAADNADTRRRFLEGSLPEQEIKWAIKGGVITQAEADECRARLEVVK